MSTILLILFFILLASFFSGVETGVYCLNRVRLRYRVRTGSKSAATLAKLMSDIRSLVCTTLAGHNFAVYGATACCTALWIHASERYAELLSTLSLAPVLLICAEIIPKSIFRSHANFLTYKAAWLLALSKGLMYPVVILLKGVTLAVDRLLGAESHGWPASAPPLLLADYLREGAREGVLSEQQDAMARNIMQLEHVSLRKAMVPLEKVTMISEEATAEELMSLAAKNSHSRVPVYRERREKVIGVLTLMDFLCDGGRKPIREYVRPAPELSVEMSLSEALYQLRRARQPMGIVKDREGCVAGIATIKDLMEEIVGELKAW